MYLWNVTCILVLWNRLILSIALENSALCYVEDTKEKRVFFLMEDVLATV